MKATIYIAGKVTGLPYKEVVEKFNKAQEQLEEKGFRVINPIELVSENTSWQKAMKTCIKSLMDADAVYALPCWQKSKGALVEIKLSTELEIDVYHSLWCLTQKYSE